MIARPPVGEILARVLPDDAAARDRARAALETLEASGVPWYLRLLTGIGAWTGGGFLLSFITGHHRRHPGREQLRGARHRPRR